ncbi:PREDICTED: neuromedin-U receptor 2-like [Branchiostoma belcheri]|uniref:Neuromedin-U receptor 2-like n=1 Tax=Branchiostoma belcheri TaxID=7741 RepID=A0A6P4ZDL1_BRABE|nr:PREDICTED: neuromedin-U receptor 2-like [Branchiostoma belcheri]
MAALPLLYNATLPAVPESNPVYYAQISLYSLNVAFGVPSNLLILGMTARHGEMRTPANLLIGSLCVADIMLLLLSLANFSPVSLSTLTFLKILKQTFFSISVANLIAVCFLRYFSVYHPLKNKRLVSKGRVKKALGVTWPLCFFLATPAAVLTTKPTWASKALLTNLHIVYTLGYSTLFFFLPMLFLLSVFVALTVKFKRKDEEGSREDQRQSEGRLRRATLVHGRAKRKQLHGQVIKCTGSLLILFGVCCLPSNVAQVAQALMALGFDNHLPTIYVNSAIISTFVLYFYMSLKPVVYLTTTLPTCKIFWELIKPTVSAQKPEEIELRTIRVHTPCVTEAEYV